LLPLAGGCVAIALMSGCAGARIPENTAGVRALYRSIGIDASMGDFTDICQTDMTAQLREELTVKRKSCSAATIERWAEKVRTGKVGTRTRVVLSGGRALVYDGAQREVALYGNGQWRLDEVPAIVP
jgi:hypothetical protein